MPDQITYLDDKDKIVAKEKAKKVVIVEKDSKGNILRTTYGTIGKK